jgi:SAM-dependent methyltransferase
MAGLANDAADGGIVGNVYDKYGTRNLIARWLMARFLGAVGDFYRQVGPRTVLEVGCGEGRLADHLIGRGPAPQRFVASDVDLRRIDDIDRRIELRAASVYDLPFTAGEFDLVICCEVLEHLERPEDALAEVTRVAKKAVILSTPREPLWRALNVARMKYLRDLGNTPGHLNHWGRRQLIGLAGTRLTDVQVKSPIPWTVLLGTPRVGTPRVGTPR